MLNYPIYNELVYKLQKISHLTPQLMRGSGNYFNHCLTFLKDLQSFADSHNLYISPDIAIALEKIITYKPKPSSDNLQKPNLRKEKDAYAVSCLDKLYDEIKSFLENSKKVFDECSDIWRQVLARLMAKGLQIDNYTYPDNLEKLEYIIAITKLDEELAPYYSHINGLIGSSNAKIILDITLPHLNL